MALLGTKTNGKIRAACAQYLQLGIGNLTADGLRYFFYQNLYRIVVADAVPREISYSKLQKTLRAVNVSLAKETIADYIRYAEDAYLLFHLQNYYANLVEKESYPKFYFSDNGIVSLFLDRKESVQLENMAALALVRAYPDDV